MKSKTDTMGKNIQVLGRVGIPPTLLHNAEILLKNYRPVVWAATGRTFCLYQEARLSTGKCLSDALEFLSEYAPERDKTRFQERVSSLIETQWLVEVVEAALVKLREYPKHGAVYFELITKTYIVYSKYTLYELLEALNLSRSSYYQKRKEAIELFAVALWGYAIPQAKGIAAGDIPDYFITA